MRGHFGWRRNGRGQTAAPWCCATRTSTPRASSWSSSRKWSKTCAGSVLPGRKVRIVVELLRLTIRANGFTFTAPPCKNSGPADSFIPAPARARTSAMLPARRTPGTMNQSIPAPAVTKIPQPSTLNPQPASTGVSASSTAKPFRLRTGIVANNNSSPARILATSWSGGMTMFRRISLPVWWTMRRWASPRSCAGRTCW